MKSLHASAALLGSALLVAALSPAARADDWNRKTFFTFSDSVEVPGAVLPAGKYVFKLVDSQSDRHTVQILNDREDHVFATVLAIPAERQIPPDKTVLTFYEVPGGNPAPIKKWYYPGDLIGQQFVYTHKRSEEILAMRGQITDTNKAQPSPLVETHPMVASTTTETTTVDTNAAASTPEPAPAPAVETPVATTPEPTPAPVAAAPETPEPQPQQPAAEPTTTAAPTTDDNAATPSELPHTASVMPLVGLIGALSLFSAAGLRAMRKSN